MSAGNCCLCGRFLARTDALAVAGGEAHFRCVAQLQVTRAPKGRVLVMVRRKGPAFSARGIR